LLPDILNKRPNASDSFEPVIVVDNIPVVGAERVEKLQNVLRKIFSKFGTIVTEHIPRDADNKTKG